MSRSFLRLDNAALIFPAIRRRDWINVFRQSVTLQEPVDPEILQQAVDDLAPRFRSMYVRLCAGVFWYYLEQAKQPPRVQPDYAYPLTHMPASALRDPLVSPLFGDLAGLPESLLFVGGDEILRDDAVRLHAALERAGCRSTLTIAPGMWHAYLLYQLQEAQPDLDAAAAFLRRIAQ